ncbi:MAG: hypothetical protein IPK10_17865 [Bacteroidetes bacterium]|nr:hypothetical protein [Bacteroidota bacterium]
MKKLLPLSLLLFLFAQSGGLLYLYTLQQKFVRAHMEEELNSPNAKFEFISMSLHDFEKGRKNSFEVKWNGKMYDVKNIKFFEDSVSMLAIHDTKEESILHEIEKLICHAEDKGHVLPSLLLKLSSLTYVSTLQQLVYFVKNKSLANCPSYISPVAFLISQDVSSPPPEKI